MKLSPARCGALAVCLALTQPAMAKDDANAVALATQFMQALQQQRYQDAAAMFSPSATTGIAATTDRLQRFGEQVGGLSTIRNVLSLPSGTTIKHAVPAGEDPTATSKKFYRIQYTATAADGKPVFYVVDVDGERQPQRLLSFAVHLPTTDAQAGERAQRMSETLQ